ncbi:hypothetical protein K2X89_08955 [Myxococcota bacterium]|nr:hypothetical protein [Myxococcota bacterium]
MKKRVGTSDELRAHYDFSKGVQGKYVDRLLRETNVVVLDPDVAEKFRTSKSVNRALRAYLKSKRSKKGAA